uniref:insulin receptor substrate 1-B-like n=1 Tax=Myxine glutinosa TaxID=7769 RepID=UPI00358DF85A
MASPGDASAAAAAGEVIKHGYLRKQKTTHKRFFVLRGPDEQSPAGRLEYYESERKWKHKSLAKRAIGLNACFNIGKRQDARNRYLIALYTKDEYFAMAAESESEQDAWFRALTDLKSCSNLLQQQPQPQQQQQQQIADDLDDNYGLLAPGPAYKEVWQVNLKPRGLGQSRNMFGVYRLCLSSRRLGFVKLNSDSPDVNLQLMNIRRCGHSDNFFFIEVGRSAVTGPGEFWMQVEDSVVAQNMHETILEAMKAMSEFPDFRPRSKSHSSSSSNPISVPPRRHLNSLPPSQTGLARRSRTDSVSTSSPVVRGLYPSGAFRMRTASEGERCSSASRPGSLAGSPVAGGSPSPANGIGTKAFQPRALAPGGRAPRLQPYPGRPGSVPASQSPSSTTSPVSLSGSSSGHGSTTDALYARPSSTSVSGSPSDGGFISSDEYGSSPGDLGQRSLVSLHHHHHQQQQHTQRSATPESFVSRTPPIPEEHGETGAYICMATARSTNTTGHHRSHSRSMPAERQATELEVEKNDLRKRTYSAGNSMSALLAHKTPAGLLEDYTPMSTGAYGGVLRMQAPYTPKSQSNGSYQQDYNDIGSVISPLPGAKVIDDGYMPMSPGVAALPPKSENGLSTDVAGSSNDDYVPMSPKSVSAPQQIVNPRWRPQADSNGYMVMSPCGNNDSCSPVECSPYVKMWACSKLSVGSTDGKVDVPCEYMNMSPGLTAGTPPDYFFTTSTSDTPKTSYYYYSLPRSFKPGVQKPLDGSRRVQNGLGNHQLFADDKSSSTSSDSLGQDSEPVACQGAGSPKKTEAHHGPRGQAVRPTCLSLGSMPLASECPPEPTEPVSPGEYVNIDFKARSEPEVTPVFDIHSHHVSPSQMAEYIHAASWSESAAKCSPLSSTSSLVTPRCAHTPSDESNSNLNYANLHLGSMCSASDKEGAYADMDCVAVSASDRSESDSNKVMSSPAVMRDRLSLLDTRPGSRPSLPNPDQGAKVIRADAQGRRRHSSETFASTSGGSSSVVAAPSTATSPSLSNDVKRLSSNSFESVCMRDGETLNSAHGSTGLAGLTATIGREPWSMSRETSAGYANGLNYIALELEDGLEPLTVGRGGKTAVPGVDLYASISFSDGGRPAPPLA